MKRATPSAPRCCRRATTHTDLLIRAQDAGIAVHVVHNASIMNAVGACGLQLYSFGATISIPFFTESWRPDSFYDKLCYNARGGMHTLCLLGAWCKRGSMRPRSLRRLRSPFRCRHQGAGAQSGGADEGANQV